MHIATTDASVIDSEEDIVWRFDSRLGSFFITHPVGFVENK
jgi:hypothetical protein